MRIRLISPIFIAGQPHAAGEVIEVGDALGRDLVRSRKAVHWSSPEPPVIESEMMETPEKAVLPRARGKPRAKRSKNGQAGG